MNCQTIQNRILALPDPRQVPAPLRERLDTCPACVAWWKQAVRLERLLEQLPVPPASAERKAALLDDLTAAGPVIRSVPALTRPSGRSLFETIQNVPGLKHLAGLAAAVLIVTGAWLVFRPGPPMVPGIASSPKHPLLEKIVQRDVELLQARAPEQRLEILGALANDLSTETLSIARVASQDELRSLASEFQKVVDRGIVAQAKTVAGLQSLSAAQKKELFERLVAKLAEAGQQADQVARESPPHAQPVLKTISEKARDGQNELATLARKVS